MQIRRKTPVHNGLNFLGANIKIILRSQFVFLVYLQMPHESTVAHEHEQRLSKEDNAAASAAAAATLKSVSETVLNASRNVVATTNADDEASSGSFIGFSVFP